jgi:hypothetical protein
MKIEIKTDKRTRYIGDYEPDKKIFTKRVQASKHLFKKFDAWGMDSEFFTDVLLPDNSQIQIFDTENNFLYIIDAKKFHKHAKYFHFKNDEDNRSQIFCSRRIFDVRNLNKQDSLQKMKETIETEVEEKQQTLF